MRSARLVGRAVVAALGALLTTTRAAAQTSFITFETGPVRPLALSPDGNTLFAVNTPDNRLEIFDVLPSGIAYRESVPVGLEPVTVAARTNSEVWVVNFLSDSVSVINADTPARVVRTLFVGDEPSDLVFAGPGGNRAFITTGFVDTGPPMPARSRSAPCRPR